jgi:CubicO group peptidase (beta-lactamase class C family)
MRSLLILALLAMPQLASAQLPAAFNDAWGKFARHYHERMAAEGMVGSSLWLMHDGDIVAREHHGFADLETRRAVDENTIYHWASITKTFTAIAVMQLRDRGRLTLDDTVVHYLPELRKVHNPYGPMEAITIRHLLSHSSGFRNPTWPWGGDEPWHEFEPTEWSQLVAMMPYTEILFEPGSRYSYSNPAIIFLGRIIEILTGDDFEVYVDKNILKPLGMHRSYFDITPYHLLPFRSNNYTVRNGTPVANGLDFDTGITVSNGGLNAPLTDMARYLSFLSGTLDTNVADVVLSRASLEEMWEPVVPVDDAGYGGDVRESAGWSPHMALGFFVLEKDGRRVVGHTGDQKSFRLFFYLEPETRTAVIGAFNTVGRPAPATDRLLSELRAQLLGQIMPVFR